MEIKEDECKPEASTSLKANVTNEQLEAIDVPKVKCGEEGSNRAPYTRAARRSKNGKRNGEPSQEEELLELKEQVKPKRATAMSNASDQRGIQVGRMYQAPTVSLIDKALVSEDCDRDVPVWINDKEKVDEVTLEKYIDEAVGIHRLSLDKALLILFSADYNLNIAHEEIVTRRVVEEIWNEDDEILFKSTLQEHGKNFSKIRELMPYRSTANIIQFYYHIKKRWRNSINPQKAAASELKIDTSELPTPTEDDECYSQNPFIKMFKNLPPVEEFVSNCMNDFCENCGQVSRRIQTTDTKNVKYHTGSKEAELKMCLLCRQYLLKCGTLRPSDLIATLKNKLASDKEIGKDWMKIIENFKNYSGNVKKSINDVSNGSGSVQATEKPTKKLNLLHKKMREEVVLKKASCLRMESLLEKKQLPFVACENIRQRTKDFKIRSKVGRRRDEWSEDEKQFAIYAIWRYGTEDWTPIMDVVPTKTRQQLVNFYEMHKNSIHRITSEDNKKPLNLDVCAQVEQRDQSTISSIS